MHKYILEHGGAGLNVNLYAGGDKSSRSVELVERQGWVSIARFVFPEGRDEMVERKLTFVCSENRCAFELGKVILENYIPLAKILRIKSMLLFSSSISTLPFVLHRIKIKPCIHMLTCDAELIKAIGNAKAVGKMLLKARSWKQLVAIGGAPLAKLAEELLGIRPVVDACFGFM